MDGRAMTSYRLSKCIRCKGLTFTLLNIISEVGEMEVVALCANCGDAGTDLDALVPKLFLKTRRGKRKVD